MEWGYLLILLNSLLMCFMTAVRKDYQQRADATIKSTLTFMLVSSLFVCVIGLGYCFFTNFSLITQLNGFVVGLSVAFAFILTINTCLCIFGAKYGSLAMITTFATLGTLVISTLYGLIFDPVKNQLGVFNVLGLVLAVVIIALGLISAKKEKTQNDNGGKNSKIFIFICLAIFLFNGSALSVYSIFTTNCASYGGFNFIFLYLFFCVLLCILALAVLLVKDKKQGGFVKTKLCIKTRPLVCALVYGATFLFAEFCALTTTSILPIIIQAPLSFAFNVITVALVDYLVYKQKLTKIQLLQIALALISGICFAL